MEMTNELVTEIVDTLAEDGDKYTLPDGRVLRLKIEPDTISVEDMWEDCCYGKIAPVIDRARYGEPYQQPRPQGFNGAARKLHIGRSYDAFWWQPPADLEPAYVETLRTLVERLLEEGFWSYGIEVVRGADHYGNAIVVDAEWIGGVEPFDDWTTEGREARRDIVQSLVDEVLPRRVEGGAQ